MVVKVASSPDVKITSANFSTLLYGNIYPMFEKTENFKKHDEIYPCSVKLGALPLLKDSTLVYYNYL